MLSTGLVVALVLLVLILLLFVFLVAVIIYTEKTTIFCPELEVSWMDPKEMGAVSDELEDVTVTTEDGVTLRGWFYRTFLQKLIAKMQEDRDKKEKGGKEDAASAAATAEADTKPAAPLIGSPTLLYLHGNSGNISHRFPIVRSLANGTQFNVFIVDYRGYGKSDGKPSEEGLKKDAEAMLKALVERDDIDKKRIIVYGQGLGGSLAFHLATQESTRKLFQAMVIENTFTSVRDMAQLLIPSWLSPLAGLVKCKFDSLALLRENKLEIPTLFVATANDEVVPHSQMKQLFRVAKRRADPACKDYVKMFRYEGTEHHNVPSLNEDAFYKNLLEWSCKVLLHDNISEEEMRELEKGFLELGEDVNDVEEEEPESLGSPEESDEDEDEDDGNDDDIADVAKSDLHKRPVKKGKKNESEGMETQD